MQQLKDETICKLETSCVINVVPTWCITVAVVNLSPMVNGPSQDWALHSHREEAVSAPNSIQSSLCVCYKQWEQKAGQGSNEIFVQPQYNAGAGS